MTLAILVFNFYPLTAVMIVMLALLNDGAILSIAYDNVKYKNKPEAWNMPMVLGVATVWASSGSSLPSACSISGARLSSRPCAHPDADVFEAVRGGTSDGLPRTHARPVLVSSSGTDFMRSGVRHANVATLIAVYGLFMTPLGWVGHYLFGAMLWCGSS